MPKAVDEMPTHKHDIALSANGNHRHGANSRWDDEGEGGFCDSYASTSNGLYTNYAGNHQHTITLANTGGNATHNNMQPYIVVYVWKRTS